MATPEETTATFGGGSGPINPQEREDKATADGVSFIEGAEDYRYYGYIPSVGSGVTIGIGVDLSQITTKEELLAHGVTEDEYNYWNSLGVIGDGLDYPKLKEMGLLETDADGNVKGYDKNGVYRSNWNDSNSTVKIANPEKSTNPDADEFVHLGVLDSDGEMVTQVNTVDKNRYRDGVFNGAKEELLRKKPEYADLPPELLSVAVGHYHWGKLGAEGNRDAWGNQRREQSGMKSGEERKADALNNFWTTIDNWVKDGSGNEADLYAQLHTVLKLDEQSLRTNVDKKTGLPTDDPNAKITKKGRSPKNANRQRVMYNELDKIIKSKYYGDNKKQQQKEYNALKELYSTISYEDGIDILDGDSDNMSALFRDKVKDDVLADIVDNGSDSDYVGVASSFVNKTDVLSLETEDRDALKATIKEDLLSKGDNSSFAYLNDNYDFLTEDDISADIQNNTTASAYWNKKEDFLDDTALAQLTTDTSTEVQSAKEQILERGEPGLLASREYKDIWKNRANYLSEDEIKQNIEDGGRNSVFWDDRGDYYEGTDLSQLEVANNPNLDQYEKIKEQRRLDILERGQESAFFDTKENYLDRRRDADEIAFYDKQERDFEKDKDISDVVEPAYSSAFNPDDESIDSQMKSSYQDFLGMPKPEPLVDKKQKRLDKRNLNKQQRLALNKARDIQKQDALILRQQARSDRKQLILDKQKEKDDARAQFLLDRDAKRKDADVIRQDKKLARQTQRLEKQQGKDAQKLLRQQDKDAQKLLRQQDRDANRKLRQGERAKRKAKRQDWWADNKTEALGAAAMGAVSLVKAGLGISSLMKAKKDIPIDEIPKLSGEWNAHMARMKELSQSGLTAAEKAEAKGDLATGYNLSLKNAMRASGGSRAAFLANAGVLNANRVEGLLQLSAMDASTQRTNMEMYGKLLSTQEQEKRERGRINAKMSYDERKRKSDLYGTLGSTLIGSAIDDINYYIGKSENKKMNESYKNLLESTKTLRETTAANTRAVSGLTTIMDNYQNPDDDTDDLPTTNTQ